jgi:Flp pilus assembly pilin Flp
VNALSKRLKKLWAFHNDEDGMETIQTVMLVAIAAIVLIVVIKFWDAIKQWLSDMWGKVKDDPGSKGDAPSF